ncbi:MAG TPA: histidine kinase [Flavobacteriaceae bacterium]|nr:histidine kinase [Flavobacteriaceae bacterium]
MFHYYKSLILCFLTISLSPIEQVFAQNKKIDSLQQVIANTSVDSVIISSTIRISRELHRQANHATQDIDIASEAVDLALESGDRLYHSRALDNLGLLYRFHQHYDIAVPLHKKAYELLIPLDGYAKDKMICANNTGVAARYMADYETAVTYYQIALKIAEETNSPLNIEIACNGLGNVYMNIPGQEDLGISYFERALRTAESAGNKRGIAMNYFSLINIYDLKEEHQKSREYLNKLAQLNHELNDQLGIGLTHKLFGVSYLNEGIELDLSKEYLEKSKQIFQTINNPLQVSDVNFNLAKLHHTLGDNPYAIQLLNDAMLTAKQLKNKGLIISISNLLFKIHKAEQDFEQALTNHMLWRDYQDSLNLQQQQLEVLALNNKYDFDKKESEIATLKKEQQINSVLLESQRNKLRSRSTILILIASLFATLFIIFFQKSQNRKMVKKSADIQAKLEKERITQSFERSLLEAEVIAMQMKINPHFLFNSLNSIKLLIQQNKNPQAINYLVHLARFNRSLLELENLSTHSLSDEIYLAEQYLKLEKKRFEDDFVFRFEYQNIKEEELKDYCIPPLLLQPYIENAIWHGLLPSDKKSKEVVIAISKEKENILIKINDNGIGRQIKPLNDKKTGIGKGMAITKKRISLFNKTNPALIKFKIIDQMCSSGNALGTSVHIEIGDSRKIA